MKPQIPTAFQGQAPEILILDVDGVLTPNSIYLDGEGGEWKSFFVPDGVGLGWLKRVGVRLAFLSGRESASTHRRAEELGIDWCETGVRDKARGVGAILEKAEISRRNAVYVGDDYLDLPAMRSVDLPVAVPNSPEEIRRSACAVTSRAGGAGAVREVCEWILQSRGDWGRVMKDYR